MRACFCLIFALLVCRIVPAQDTTRILFIGNSFTYGHQMPGIVKAFADSAGLPVLTAMYAPPGVSVGDTAPGSMAHMSNPALFQLIRSRKWDFAVIQDNQGRFVLDSAKFPGASKVVQGHLNLMDSVKAGNSCARIILFGGWAFKNGLPPYGNTGAEMIARILVNYRVLNDTMKEVVAPIGEAWIQAIGQLPALDLWDADEAHPSYAGSYLTASVLFSTIFRQPNLGNPYQGSLPPATASLLRGFGDTAVYRPDLHVRYNLGGVRRLQAAYVNDRISVPGHYLSYAWYKEGVFLGEDPDLVPEGNGHYQALVKEEDGCLVKTCSFLWLNTGLPEFDTGALRVFPNPVRDGSLTVIYPAGCRPREARLIDVTGREEVLSPEFRSDRLIFSAGDLKPGCYVLVVSSESRVLRKTLIVTE